MNVQRGQWPGGYEVLEFSSRLGVAFRPRVAIEAAR